MHIAMVHRDLHQRTRGGICTVYRALAAAVASRGHQITLITQETPDPVTVTGAQVVALPRTEDLAAHRAAVADLLWRIEPDVIDCSTWEAELLTYLTQHQTGRAPVLVRGEFSARTLGAPALAEDERELLRHADRVIAVSHYAARDLRDAYDIPAPTVVHNGIDHTRFHPGPAHSPASGVQVSLNDNGELTDPKPISALLESGRSVPPFTPDPHGRIRLVWVGKITPMKGWDLLEQIAFRLHGIATITAVLGHSAAFCPVTYNASHLTVLHDLDDSDMPALFRSADWLLSTSRWEGFGLAIAEAIACGTPAFLPETLGVAPELLATGGGRTYRDADDLARLVTAQSPPSAVLPRHFDWDLNADTTLDNYRQLLQE
ncbi:glycosyltransferase family 4 protein [Nocardia sp. XZ_19_369]|uniref:glycosyltransferase family 4 protein n=1 Tax=Nocardia sp. XZ_19_369 TaxID=2769487 RepID=UPI0018904AA4|nr:glycosyltransferase family 4 protein [Nocardia sp. XZ_19_369]